MFPVREVTNVLSRIYTVFHNRKREWKLFNRCHQMECLILKIFIYFLTCSAVYTSRLFFSYLVPNQVFTIQTVTENWKETESEHYVNILSGQCNNMFQMGYKPRSFWGYFKYDFPVYTSSWHNSSRAGKRWRLHQRQLHQDVGEGWGLLVHRLSGSLTHDSGGLLANGVGAEVQRDRHDDPGSRGREGEMSAILAGHTEDSRDGGRQVTDHAD